MVTHQLQVERRTGKVRRPETDVLPLSHAQVVLEKGSLNGCVYMVLLFVADNSVSCLVAVEPVKKKYGLIQNY